MTSPRRTRVSRRARKRGVTHVVELLMALALIAIPLGVVLASVAAPKLSARLHAERRALASPMP
jgi:Tfp pilus assembly protein FimT